MELGAGCVIGETTGGRGTKGFRGARKAGDDPGRDLVTSGERKGSSCGRVMEGWTGGFSCSSPV